MESLDKVACFVDDLLDFSSDIGEEDDDDDQSEKSKKTHSLSSSSFSLLAACRPTTNAHPPEFVEEELEWISNKDAFPMVESFVDIIPNHPSIATTNHHSPVSVLENSTCSMNRNISHGSSTNRSGNINGVSTMMISLPSFFKVPGKARSKHRRKRRRDMLGQQWQCWAQEKVKPRKPTRPNSTIGRKCLHCEAEKTPQWRAGPLGPKTLCNACGVRYKSGRLVPEYRPASSPTFCNDLHSNSHRKIVEMRRQKVFSEPGLKIAEIG